MKISFIITARDEERTLALTVENLRRTARQIPFEIIIVDDCSGIPVSTYIPEASDLTIIRNDVRLGVAKSPNIAAQRAKYQMLCFTEGHIALPDGWVDVVRRSGVGSRPAIFSAMREDFDSLELFADLSRGLPPPVKRGRCHYGLIATPPPVPTLNSITKPISSAVHEVPMVSSSCCFIQRTLFYDLGEYESSFDGFGSLEDTELCIRARSFGFPALMLPTLPCYHWENPEKTLLKRGGEWGLPESYYYTGAKENLTRLVYLHFSESEFDDYLRVFNAEALRTQLLNESLRQRRAWIMRRRVCSARQVMEENYKIRNFRAKICPGPDIVICDSVGSVDTLPHETLLLATSSTVLTELRSRGFLHSRLLSWYSPEEIDNLAELNSAMASELFSQADTGFAGLEDLRGQVSHHLAPIAFVARILQNIRAAEKPRRLTFVLEDSALQILFDAAEEVLGLPVHRQFCRLLRRALS